MGSFKSVKLEKKARHKTLFDFGWSLPGGEIYDIGDEPFLWESPDETVGQKRLPGSACSDQTYFDNES